MKYYLGEDFVEKYTRYLQNEEKCPYFDIDAVSSKCVDYYNDITMFLNSVFKTESFKNPAKEKIPFAICDKSNCQYFTSDTFGFSALFPRGNAWKPEGNYPYVRYLEAKKEGKVENKEKCEFVAKCIYETRTIGGAFIWPKVYLENHRNSMGKKVPGWHSIYNYYRGSNGYIQDRVDVTLFEIKSFFDIYKDKKEYLSFLDSYKEKYRENVLFNYANKPGKPPYTSEEKEKEMKAVFSWLSRFESFEDYVEKLFFTPFTIKKNDEYWVKNLEEKNIILTRENITSISEMSSKQLHVFLSNLVEYTKERSNLMEESILTCEVLKDVREECE